jgi:lipoprotein-releasing system permease protein
MDGIRAATPFIHAQIMLRSGRYASGAILKGVDPREAVQVVNLNRGTESNRFEALAGAESSEGDNGPVSSPGVILGKELARTLGVSRGDELFAISALGTSLTPFGTRVPHMKRLEVVGLFDSGMYDYDSSFAFVSIRSAQKLLRLDQSVHGIEVKIDDIYRADEISEEILNRLGPDYWAQDWMEMNKNFFSALKLEKVVMFIILVLIILVAAFNIISTLIMMVMEKSKDIAILKSMGATARSIMKIFMLEGLIIGMIGTVLGLAGGGIICFLLQRYEFVKLPSDVYYISTLPVRIQGVDVILVALSAIAISFLATLYPSYRASRLEPVSAIRYE